MAGCDSAKPVVVYERPRAPDPTDGGIKWEQVAWRIWCADGQGCRGVIDVQDLPPAPRGGAPDSALSSKPPAR